MQQSNRIGRRDFLLLAIRTLGTNKRPFFRLATDAAYRKGIIDSEIGHKAIETAQPPVSSISIVQSPFSAILSEVVGTPRVHRTGPQ